MAETLKCYKCGTSLAALSLPLRRLDECPQCRRELHVCCMCQSYDPRVPKGCSEDDAPEVREKERANFCDYFKPSANAYTPGGLDAERAAQAELDALFGDGDDPSSPGSAEHSGGWSEAENLFKK